MWPLANCSRHVAWPPPIARRGTMRCCRASTRATWARGATWSSRRGTRPRHCGSWAACVKPCARFWTCGISRPLPQPRPRSPGQLSWSFYQAAILAAELGQAATAERLLADSHRHLETVMRGLPQPSFEAKFRHAEQRLPWWSWPTCWANRHARASLPKACASACSSFNPRSLRPRAYCGGTAPPASGAGPGRIAGR